MFSNLEEDDLPPGGSLRQLFLSMGKLDAMDEFPGKRKGMKMLNDIMQRSICLLRGTRGESVVMDNVGKDNRETIRKKGFVPLNMLEAYAQKINENAMARCKKLFISAESKALNGIIEGRNELVKMDCFPDLITVFEELLSTSSAAATSSTAAATSSAAAATSSEPSQNLSAEQATEFLVSVMYIGSLCKRKGERQCIRKHNPEITDEQLLEISKLSESISESSNKHMAPRRSIDIPITAEYFTKGSEPTNKLVKKRKIEVLSSCESVKESLQNRIRKAHDLVQSRQDIKDLIDKITGSKYMETDGFAIPYFLEALVGVFWDLENLGIPSDRDPSTIVEEIGDCLRDSQYKGDFTVYGYGNVKQLGADKFKIIVGDQMELFHVENLEKTKTDKSDKHIISSAITWVWNRILQLYEPQLLVVISQDIDFLSTIKEIKHRGFKVGVFNNSVNSVIASAASFKNLWRGITNKLSLMPIKVKHI